MDASCSLAIQKWDEREMHQWGESSRISAASVEYGLQGSLEGKATVEYVLCYSYYDSTNPHGSTAKYLGYMLVNGTAGGRSGTFVCEDSGTFSDGQAVSILTIVAGSGKDGFENVSGTGRLIAGSKEATIKFDFKF